MAVGVDIPSKLGNIGSRQELLPETEMETTNGVSHISSLLVDSHALLKKLLLPPALNNVILTIPDNHTLKIFSLDLPLTLLLLMLLLSKLKS